MARLIPVTTPSSLVSAELHESGEPPIPWHRITSTETSLRGGGAHATVPVTDDAGPGGDRGALGARSEPAQRPGLRWPHDPASAPRCPAGGRGAERPHEHRVLGSRRDVRSGEELRAGAARRGWRSSGRGPRPLCQLQLRARLARYLLASGLPRRPRRVPLLVVPQRRTT